MKKSFDDVPEVEVLAKPLIYCHFAKGIGEPKYMPVMEWNALNKILTDALRRKGPVRARSPKEAPGSSKVEAPKLSSSTMATCQPIFGGAW